MSEEMKVPIPRWFWIVAVVALLWNLIGCMIFVLEVFAKEAMMESFTEEQKAWSRAIPLWVYAVFAVSVVTGMIGSIGLLRRSSIAILCFGISLGAVVIQMGYTMLIAGGLEIMGPSGGVMPVLVVSLSTVWLFFGIYCNAKGLL